MNDNYDVDEITNDFEVDNVGSRIQLWQFLFRLLLDKSKSSIVAWSGVEGEFDILKPDALARLWCETKEAKTNVSFANIQRSLRTYYAQSLITKVVGHQHRYKFSFDAKYYLGYSFPELLNNLCIKHLENNFKLN